MLVLSPAEELEAVLPPSTELRREMERLTSAPATDVSDAVPAPGADPEGAGVDSEVSLVQTDAAELKAVMPPSPELRHEMDRLVTGEDEPPSPGSG